MFSKPIWMYEGSDFYDYHLNQSVRYSAKNAYNKLLKTSGWNGDASGTTWSFSAWVKRGDLERKQHIVMWSGTSNRQEDIRFHTDDRLRWYCHNSDGSAADSDIRTSRVFRDTTAWYHILCVKDTRASVTAADRNIIYINGERAELYSSPNYSSDDYGLYAGNGDRAAVGGPSTTGTPSPAYDGNFDGYIAEVQFVNGTALGPEYFGKFKEGIWIAKPSYKDQGGSYGTNGFYLSGVTEQSGNNLSFSGTNMRAGSVDVVPDTPENNFATFNFADGNGPDLREAGLEPFGDTSYSVFEGFKGTFAMSSGKWYWEANIVDMNNIMQIGIVPTTATAVNASDGTNLSYHTDAMIYQSNGNKRIGTGGLTTTPSGASNTSYGDSYTDGNIIGVALDLDSSPSTLTFYKNGDTQGTAFSSLASDEYVALWTGIQNSHAVFNFGQDDSFGGTKTSGSANASDSNGKGQFYYTPPSGHLACCTANLSDPEKINPNNGENSSDHFAIETYTGDNTTNERNIGFAPDFLWFKHRDGTSAHVIYDIINGPNSGIQPSDALVENENATSSQDLISFDNDGFTVGVGSQFGSVNSPGHNIVTWAFKAGGTAVTNNDGTLTSQVSANTDAGFSIVTYSGSNSAGSFGHGLNQAPEFIIIKQRNDTGFWAVGANIGGWTWSSDYLILNTTTQKLTNGGTTIFTSAPTNTVVNIGGGSATSTSGKNLVAYCFHSVAGYSKIGTYEGGQDSSLVSVVHTGFRPRFLIIKNTDFDELWVIHDSDRNPTGYNDEFNAMQHPIYANLDNAESFVTGRAVDFLSNGFKVRGTDTSVNRKNNTHLYLAIGDQPFKYANAM